MIQHLVYATDEVEKAERFNDWSRPHIRGKQVNEELSVRETDQQLESNTEEAVTRQATFTTDWNPSRFNEITGKA